MLKDASRARLTVSYPTSFRPAQSFADSLNNTQRIIFVEMYNFHESLHIAGYLKGQT